MRFGISATSLICPKNLRTRLRPVNVCCAIVASRYRCPGRATLPNHRLAARPDLNFHPFRRTEDRIQAWRPESVLQTFKTQNDARSDLGRTRPSKPSHYGLQKPEIAYLPTACGETPLPCLPPFRAAAPIWDGNRGDSR